MKKRSYTLYIDESGDFESAAGVKSLAGGQKARNQIVGFLVPDDGRFTENIAESMLHKAHERAGTKLEHESHAKDHDDRFVNSAASALLGQLPGAGIQPVRIVNREQMDYGGHDATYTQMVAELIIRIFSQKFREEPGRVRIQLHGANIVRIRNGQKVMGPRGVETIPPDEYEQRIREALAFVTVRLGLADSAKDWELTGVQLSPARKVFALQICDLLSNASVSRFARIKEDTKIRYLELLGSYDFTLKALPLLDQIDDHLESGDPALAIRLIAEHSISDTGYSDQLLSEIEKRRNWAIESFAAQSAPQRRPQSELLVGWVTQLERQRFLETGELVAKWLIKNLITPLRARDPADPNEVDEFEYGVRRWHLKLLTHQGRLKEARATCARIDELVPAIAGRVDAIPKLLEGQVAQAVHFTDCLEFDQAIERLKNVDAIHMDMLALFGKKYRIEPRSEARGKTLSSWSQAEAYASCGRDMTRLRDARQLNELALPNFSSSRDISQLHQYRCQIETLAGDYPAARAALSKAISIAGDSHRDLASAIHQYSFELMHWWRIGANVLRNAPDSDEAATFLDAYSTHPYANCSWGDEEFREYPAHGLLRHGSSIAAATNDGDLAMILLKQLGTITDPIDKPIFGAILLAAMAETATVLWTKDRRTARLILGESPNQYPGVMPTIKRCRIAFEGFDGLTDWVSRLGSDVQEVLAGRSDAIVLLDRSSCIGY